VRNEARKRELSSTSRKVVHGGCSGSVLEHEHPQNAFWRSFSEQFSKYGKLRTHTTPRNDFWPNHTRGTLRMHSEWVATLRTNSAEGRNTQNVLGIDQGLSECTQNQPTTISTQRINQQQVERTQNQHHSYSALRRGWPPSADIQKERKKA
jgi:hypothetical protein